MNNPGLLFPIDQPLRKILDFLPYPFLISESRNGVLTHVYLNNPFIDEIGYTLEEMPTINEWYSLGLLLFMSIAIKVICMRLSRLSFDCEYVVKRESVLSAPQKLSMSFIFQELAVGAITILEQ